MQRDWNTMIAARRQLAQRVAAELFPSESSIDAAIKQVTTLATTITEGLKDANLSATVGHVAVRRIGASIGALMHARDEIIEAHKELDQAKTGIGLRTHDFGGGIGKDEIETVDVLPKLRSVRQ